MNFQLTKKHHIGEMPRVDWMDRLTFKEITYRNNDEKKKSNQVSSDSFSSNTTSCEQFRHQAFSIIASSATSDHGASPTFRDFYFATQNVVDLITAFLLTDVPDDRVPESCLSKYRAYGRLFREGP